MSISPITKEQWISVVKNAVIAGLVSFAYTLQVSGLTKPGIVSAGIAAGVAIVKVIEKLFTPAV